MRFLKLSPQSKQNLKVVSLCGRIHNRALMEKTQGSRNQEPADPVPTLSPSIQQKSCYVVTSESEE